MPLGTKHPKPELEYVIEDAQAAKLIVHPELEDRLTEIAQDRNLPLHTTDQLQGDKSVLADVSKRNMPNIDTARRAMILYTSGSTGKPKGVVTTHQNVLAQVDSLVQAWQWKPADKILHLLPMHHIHGIINVLGCAMRVGATCEFMPFDPESVWERLACENAEASKHADVNPLTLLMAVPTIYAKLIATWQAASDEVQQRWSDGAKRLRLMVSGSAALPVPTLETWEKITGHRLLERYGMTEIGMGLSNPLHGERRPGHVGRPLPFVDVRRTDTDGNEVEDSVPGEIEVKGPTVFQQYWNREQATVESFRDGWFRTGDVAVVDNGDFRILGRNSVDIIKTGGYKVSALEIEDVLRNHAAIQDCAVVGIDDEEWGERIAVCAILSSGQSLKLDELRDWCKTQLASYKAPTLLCIQQQLPRNAMGKVQKKQVQKFFSGGA